MTPELLEAGLLLVVLAIAGQYSATRAERGLAKGLMVLGLGALAWGAGAL